MYEELQGLCQFRLVFSLLDIDHIYHHHLHFKKTLHLSKGTGLLRIHKTIYDSSKRISVLEKRKKKLFSKN